MRIIAGTYGSRIIEAVEGASTRPTANKVKEAVFSRIGPYFDGGDMLDLFAGSGSISLEAISRGMAHSTLVDSNIKAITCIKKNIATLEAQASCDVLKMDYKSALRKLGKQKYDFIFLDPPYKKQQISAILHFLSEHDMLKRSGDIVCESLKEDVFEENIGYFKKTKDVTYGITRITYYRKRENI